MGLGSTWPLKIIRRIYLYHFHYPSPHGYLVSEEKKYRHKKLKDYHLYFFLRKDGELYQQDLTMAKCLIKEAEKTVEKAQSRGHFDD